MSNCICNLLTQQQLQLSTGSHPWECLQHKSGWITHLTSLIWKLWKKILGKPCCAHWLLLVPKHYGARGILLLVEQPERSHICSASADLGRALAPLHNGCSGKYRFWHGRQRHRHVFAPDSFDEKVAVSSSMVVRASSAYRDTAKLTIMCLVALEDLAASRGDWETWFFFFFF